MKELLIRQAQLNAALDLDKNEMQVAPNLEARNLVASQLPINFQTARLLKSLRINGSDAIGALAGLVASLRGGGGKSGEPATELFGLAAILN